MAKASHQLVQSFRLFFGLTIATLTPLQLTNTLLASGDEPVVIYHRAGEGPPTAISQSGYVHFDRSCEPSFHGGNCQDCCLELWQGYCSERTCAHAYSSRQFGIGCLRFGRGCGTCTTVTSDHAACPCHNQAYVTQADNDPPIAGGRRIDTQPVVEMQSNVPTDASRPGAGQLAPPDLQGERSPPSPAPTYERSWPSDPAEVAPPKNRLPVNPAPLPPEPSGTNSDAFNSAPGTPPLPPRINFFVEPQTSGRPRFTTISTTANVGTIRLLHQLDAK